MRRSASWIGEEIREAKRALRRSELANRSRLIVHREIFVKERNLLKGLHHLAKKEHYRNKLTDCIFAKLFYGVKDDSLDRKSEPQ